MHGSDTFSGCAVHVSLTLNASLLQFHLDGAMETPQGGFSHLMGDYSKAKSILEHYLRRRIVRGSGRKMRTEEDRRWFRCAFVKDC